MSREQLASKPLCRRTFLAKVVCANCERPADEHTGGIMNCPSVPPKDDLAHCPDLYELLLNVQNGIDSVAQPAMANRIIRRIDKLRGSVTKEESR